MNAIARRRPKRSSWQTAAVAAWKGGDVRTICVNLEPAALCLRLKGTRREFRLPWAIIFDRAVLAESMAIRRAADGKRKSKPRRFVVSRGKL